MTKRFKVGDHVSWNSEAGRVSGTIIALHTADFNYKGYVHHASKDDHNTRSKAIRQITSQPIKAAPSTMCDEDVA
jgi:hypothetical protein